MFYAVYIKDARFSVPELRILFDHELGGRKLEAVAEELLAGNPHYHGLEIWRDKSCMLTFERGAAG
ncbi:MAG TPA: hypothetical protein VEA80_05645 [Vitreimonas sp.]|uniref:hypothetical protein n=1 Tax=Vitreimonas sp. TaxID=3069702 RepID=UPI002D590172|nr:hypothetical protein [Vitreimonas sp.]HYD86935.1 hypothetical protein [Vitreimonas sp.]